MASVNLNSLSGRVTERYVLDGITEPELMKQMEIPDLNSHAKWITWLRANGIFKNAEREEKIRILLESRRRNVSMGRWMFLVLANGVLLDLTDLETKCERKSQEAAQKGEISIHAAANQSDVSPTTRKHLFNFDTGRWASDLSGYYNRRDTDRDELKKLSRFHNTIHEALAQSRRGQELPSGPFTSAGFRQMDRIVNINHHRQLPDILGIIHLIQRNLPGALSQGERTLVSVLCKHLHDCGKKWLQPTDPRIQLFELLKELPQDQEWDPKGHMVMAFDAYCRHLWFDRLGSNDLKAYYSFNQASFPRSEPGEFYEKFRGKSLGEIRIILQKVDAELEQYSVATFCLWHTSIHYLFQERRYSDSEALCRELSKRILGPQELHLRGFGNSRLDFATIDSHCRALAKSVLEWLRKEPGVPEPQKLHQGQLGFDIVKTFYLLGRSQEELARSPGPLSFREARKILEQALLNLDMAHHLRLLTAEGGSWDPLLKSVLMAMISVGKVLGLVDGVDVWEEDLKKVNLAIAEEDRS
ncbi:hypothetical protein IFR05_007286 [Cadophora sp. M221]|nr:hypothetical protein IFR05_007286 [Cadophora sp. M221]